MARAKQKAWPFFLMMALILAALPAGYWLLLSQEGAASTAPLPSAPKAEERGHEIKLSDIKGNVQIRRGNGEWAIAKPGETLNSWDGVRTSDGSYAVLVGGEAYEVRMEPGTEVSMQELSKSISKMLIGSGMATAKVKGAARHTFEVKSSTGDAVARTKDGTFAISSNGQGTVAVGTQEGEVEFLGSGKTVIVRAGQQSIIRPGQAPTDPVTIPSSLLLKVNLPAYSDQKQRKLIVSGTVEPGALVMIGEKTTRADKEGRFSQPLIMREGAGQVVVKAKSVSGLSAESAHKVNVDTGTNFQTDPVNWDAPTPNP